MEKRIKFVWILSIVTMALIFCGQTYWLYRQYDFSMSETAKQLEADCNQVLKNEQQKREVERLKSSSRRDEINRVIMKGDVYGILPDAKKARNISAAKLKKEAEKKDSIADKPLEMTFYSSLTGDSLDIKLYDMDFVYAADFTSMYNNAVYKKIQPQVIDSLLKDKGYAGIEHFKTIKSQRVAYPARYEVSGIFSKVCHVTYSSNPFKYEKVEFDVKIPIKSAISSMLTPLIATLLMLIVLAFCLAYQVKTIIIQKRIDGIRHEFMKNMIFEMKQPEEDSSSDGGVRIGETHFYYSLNELQHGSERVILTSRQAEIMRILCENANQVVLRETLLMQAWGDDSYSNSLALNVQISYLRRALKSDELLSIEVLYKRGYMLKVKTKETAAE